MVKRKNKSSRRKKGGVKGEGAGGVGEKKDKSNRRKKGGVKGHGAGEGGEKNEVEKMVKQKHYCNQRTSSLEPDPLQDNQQLAYQLEVLGGLCVKEVEGDGNCCFRSLSDQVGISLTAAVRLLLQYVTIPYVFIVFTSSMVFRRNIMRSGLMWLISWNKTKRILYPS